MLASPPAPTHHPTVIVPAPTLTQHPHHHVTVVTMSPSAHTSTVSTSRQNLDTIVQVWTFFTLEDPCWLGIDITLHYIFTLQYLLGRFWVSDTFNVCSAALKNVCVVLNVIWVDSKATETSIFLDSNNVSAVVLQTGLKTCVYIL